MCLSMSFSAHVPMGVLIGVPMGVLIGVPMGAQVAPDLVNAAWYDEVRTDMLEVDGRAHFGVFPFMHPYMDPYMYAYMC